MGRVHDYSNNKDEIGLLGYNEGERTIFLDSETGKAEFGKQGKGRIIINPINNIAKIYSGNFYNEATGQEQNEGMLINLTNP